MNRKNVATEVNRSKFMFADKTFDQKRRKSSKKKTTEKVEKKSIESDIDDRKAITIRIPNILIIVRALQRLSIAEKSMKPNCRSVMCLFYLKIVWRLLVYFDSIRMLFFSIENPFLALPCSVGPK